MFPYRSHDSDNQESRTGGSPWPQAAGANVSRILSLTTIGGLIDNGYILQAHCNSIKCRHRSKLDLEELAKKLGRDHGCLHDQLAPKLYCSKCKSKDIGLIISSREVEGRGHA
jgi:hypothetical protein